MSRLEIADYADRYLVERFATLPGVAQVGLFGQQFYSPCASGSTPTPWPPAA